VKIGISYSSATDFRTVVSDVAQFEGAGAQVVWLGESYGFDSVSALGALAAATRGIELGFGVIPVQTRTPALIAMSAAGVDALSGGRAILGLGVSGPQVVEGWHDVPFQSPLTRLREVVETCRRVWSLERAVPNRLAADGHAYRALKLINQPVRSRIPIFLAASGPHAVSLTAEVADGWLPAFLWPEKMPQVWGEALTRGTHRRNAESAPLEIAAGVYFAVDEGVEEALAAHRRRLAHYIGGMGTRATNFYARIAAAYGFPAEADEIQQLYLAGRRGEAEALVPDELVSGTSVIGDRIDVARRLQRFAAAGVTTLNLSFATQSAAYRVRQLDACRSAVDSMYAATGQPEAAG
jgi:F420-dependent oxidoreductase-like protein